MKSTIALLALLGSQLASADVLTYTGKPFTEAYEGAGSVTATFVTKSALVAGTTLTAADIASFSVSALGFTVTNSDASFTSLKFVLGAGALPTSWNIAVEKSFEGDNTLPEQWSSFNGTGDWSNLDAFARDDTLGNALGTNGKGYSVIWNTPGTWSASAVGAVPEPSSWALMGLGAGALFIARRRTNKA